MTSHTKNAGPADRRPGNPPSSSRPRRHALWLLAIPVVLYLLTPVVANTIHPIVLGMPFIVFYTIAVTVLAPIVVMAVAHMDPLYRHGESEPVPVDIAFGATNEEVTGQAGPIAPDGNAIGPSHDGEKLS